MNSLELQRDVLEAMPRLQLGMIYKLSIHANKGTWRSSYPTLKDAYIKLLEEVGELNKAIVTGGNYAEIADEASDISNMAMIIMHLKLLGVPNV